MDINKFVAPEIIFGMGAISQAGESVQRLGARKVFMVTDEGVIKSRWVEKALFYLDQAGLEYEVWSDLTTNPKDNEVEVGVKKYISSGCDAVMAIGGGSPIDAAKAIAVIATNGGIIQDYEGVNKINKPLPPMVILPTTAGSGSEVSQFAIIVDRKRKVKMTIISKSLMPDIAIVDPVMLQTKDARLTAATGMDALSHAVESYVSLAATPLSDIFALNSIRLIAGNLSASVACSTNMPAKESMSMASLQAGLAFSNAILGITHAMTHQVDGLLDSHHGETNAILLPYAMEYNLIANVDRFCHIAEALGEDIKDLSKWKAAEKAVKGIRRLVKNIGLAKRLSEIGIDESVVEKLAVNALKDACLITNPRDSNLQDIVSIYRKAL
ncbi:MAG: iron-containing alcohol dehydrogenase [Firmicutes bacterium]|nr:iron-containing alcohol dehydrogenase [Bacillota bacterium]